VSSPIHRPQRQLTEAEWTVVRRTKLLNLHAALMMGIVDPVPNPSPMSEAEGIWVREHVWPDWIRDIERKYPFGFWRWTNCERGTCWNCLNNRCDICVHRQRGGPNLDDGVESVHNHRGHYIATLIERPGGEPCVWWCRCPCAKTGEAPARPERVRPEPDTPAPEPEPPRRASPPQEALFDLELM
jgi:hypothetical protein